MRNWLAASLGALLLVVCPPCLTALQQGRAEDEPAKAEQKTDQETGKEHEPKDDPFKGTLDLTIWSIIVFLLLLTVLWKYAWGPIIDGLDKREKSIAQAMHDAQQAREDAQKLRVELQRERDQAAQQVSALLDAARRDAERLKEEIAAQGRAQVQEERDRALREIRMEADQTRADLRKEAAQLAVLISSKVIRRHLNEDDHRQLVEEALDDMRQAVTERQRVLTGLT